MVPQMSPPQAPRVAVVTVSYGSTAVLPAFLASLPAASAAPIEVVVADNKPELAVAELSTAWGARYLPLPENRGYGGAANAAIETLPDSVEWVLVSNPDVILAPGAIDALLVVGEEDARIAVVGPAILTADGDLYPSARTIPSLRTGVGHALFMNLWGDNPWTRAYRHDAESHFGVRRDVGWLSGACLLIRRSAFEQLGGFDPGYFMYFEDVDLGYRLGKLGYRNVYLPVAVVTHTGAHSTTTESGRMIRAHHDSARRFLNKKYAGPMLWPIRAALTVGLSVRSWLVSRRQGH